MYRPELRDQRKVSIIIPVYNAASYINHSVDSVLEQNIGFEENCEIVFINDGSTDDSAAICRDYQRRYPNNIQYLEQKNQGQGVARNKAINVAQGKYILFVDADDFIEKDLLEKTVSMAEKDNPDLVNFSWRYYFEYNNSYKHVDKNPISNMPVLEDSQCEELLKMKYYLSWSNLYRRSFLLENNIKFGEGYIYEDNPFIAHVASTANRISILHEPLYNQRKGQSSSTNRSRKTPKHYVDFLKASEESYRRMTYRNQYSAYYLCDYQLNRFFMYLRRRTPLRYHLVFSKKMLALLHTQHDKIVLPDTSDGHMKHMTRFSILKRKKYFLFLLIVVRVVYIRGLRSRIGNMLSRKANATNEPADS